MSFVFPLISVKITILTKRARYRESSEYGIGDLSSTVLEYDLGQNLVYESRIILEYGAESFLVQKTLISRDVPEISHKISHSISHGFLNPISQGVRTMYEPG